MTVGSHALKSVLRRETMLLVRESGMILNVSPVYFVLGRKLGLEDTKIKKVWKVLKKRKRKRKDGSNLEMLTS